MQKEILLLGDERLYRQSEPVQREELPRLAAVVDDLHDTLMTYRAKYGAGRAVAAPQIGVFKRIIYMHIDGPCPMRNPVLSFPDDEMMPVLDDCMSFPGLYVRLMRHRRCTLRYRDMAWSEQEMYLEGDLAELIQHEYDHLDGILATMRAAGNKALVYKPFA